VERIAARIVNKAYVVRTDATGLKVLDPASPENIVSFRQGCVNQPEVRSDL
jgi:hypothetical protein